MSLIQIKNRWTDKVIYECECKTIRECVEKAIEEGADLRSANLWGTNLNCIYYKTKVTKKQKEQIVNNDLFEVKEE